MIGKRRTKPHLFIGRNIKEQTHGRHTGSGTFSCIPCRPSCIRRCVAELHKSAGRSPHSAGRCPTTRRPLAETDTVNDGDVLEIVGQNSTNKIIINSGLW